MRSIILLVAMLVATTAQADIYKCVINGKTTFSQTPCAADAVIIKPEVYTPYAQDIATRRTNDAAMNAASKRIERDYGKLVLERRIADSDEAIANLMRERDRREAELRAEQANANTHYRKAFSAQISAISREYNTSIQLERESRLRLMSEYSRLLRSKD